MDCLTNERYHIDTLSFDLGMITAFCEIVGGGIKPLALSPIVPFERLQFTAELSADIEKNFGVKSYLEKDFITCDLATAEELKDCGVIFYYKEEKVLNEYLMLKEKAEKLNNDHDLYATEIREISVAFRRLLGYTKQSIDEHYEKTSDTLITAVYPKLPLSNPYYASNDQLLKCTRLIEALEELKVNGQVKVTAFKGGNRAPIPYDCGITISVKCKNSEAFGLLNEIRRLCARFGAETGTGG